MVYSIQGQSTLWCYLPIVSSSLVEILKTEDVSVRVTEKHEDDFGCHTSFFWISFLSLSLSLSVTFYRKSAVRNIVSTLRQSCFVQGYSVSCNTEKCIDVKVCCKTCDDKAVAVIIGWCRSKEISTVSLREGQLVKRWIDHFWLILYSADRIIVCWLFSVPATCVSQVILYSADRIIVCWLFNVPATCVSQGRICSDNFRCCHTDIRVADQVFHHPVTVYWHRANQSQHWPCNTRRVAG